MLAPSLAETRSSPWFHRWSNPLYLCKYAKQIGKFIGINLTFMWILVLSRRTGKCVVSNLDITVKISRCKQAREQSRRQTVYSVGCNRDVNVIDEKRHGDTFIAQRHCFIHILNLQNINNMHISVYWMMGTRISSLQCFSETPFQFTDTKKKRCKLLVKCSDRKWFSTSIGLTIFYAASSE